MLIPGQFIALLTFPGVIVHELAHQLFCRLFRVAVLDVCYFQFGSPVGFVQHEKPSRPSQQIWIGVGPFFLNTLVGAVISMPAAIPVFHFESTNPLDYFLIWLGVSIAMHAFPSIGDAQSIWQSLRDGDVSILTKIFAFPIVGLIFAGAAGSVFWLDLLYGVGIALLVPNLLLLMFA